MGKKIFVEDAEKRHLCKVFKCSRMLVWKALNFKSDSELARKIRYVSLKEFGGVANWEPAEVETSHEEVANTMTQTFGERVKLVASKSDTSVVVYVDGKEERRENCENIPAFMTLQKEVGYMAMSL